MEAEDNVKMMKKGLTKLNIKALYNDCKGLSCKI